MFETLEDVFEKSKRPLDRRWPPLMYSTDVVVGLFYLTEGCECTTRSGLSSEPSCSCCL
jgi:hypothetical protein